ncbi:MAG: alpha-galactosidase [Lachnospiraceae bacterium]|nr:alpha-galactosidase [Lachnospiraceae bacterium]
MAILFQSEQKRFTLHTKHTTYQMKVDAYGFLLHLYYGKKSDGDMSYLLTYADRGFSGNPEGAADRTYSLDFLPQEFPVQGMGDYRSPLLCLRNAEGVYGCDLRYKGHEIRRGKYGLKGLPAVYASEEEAETLAVTLKDEKLGLSVELLYGVLSESDIITRSAVLSNDGGRDIVLEKVQSACLDFVSGDFDVLTFYGKHMMERSLDRSPAGHGARVVGSRRGTSSHEYNPFLILADRDTGETHGRCWSMQFVYSGGFKGEVEKDQYDQTRFQMGLMDEMFAYPLAPGEDFTAPEVIMSYSGEGFAGLSGNLHRCIRKHVCRGKYRDGGRPVLLNSWEAAYFAFDGKTILKLAGEAKELGMDMVVMDDGWFGERNDDHAGLGDWHVNEKKLGCSLRELSGRIHGMGLKFGIWVEPEMVNENSELFREHPDWALLVPGRAKVLSRDQLVLDFSRKEVVDGIFRKICAVLDDGMVDYLKWDYNRSIANVYSHTANNQGRVLYDYVLGLYDFLERLHEKYPDLLIEGCSGGGGRFDAGMLYYTPQIWCSDNTDAIDRLRIQYGTSFGYPMSAVGAHVSASPNEQCGRRTPLQTRFAAAMTGAFGYEMDPSGLSEEEREEIRRQVTYWKKHAALFHNGDYYRLTDPSEAAAAAWAYVSEDGKEALVAAVLQEVHGNMAAQYIRLQGLTPGSFYQDSESGQIYSANALTDMGLPLPVMFGEYGSYQCYLVRLGEEADGK